MANTAGSLPVKAGRPKRADRLALSERDAEISRMAARGIPYSEIAAHFGFAGGSGSVANCIKRARQAIRAQGAEELRDAQRATLDAVLQSALEDLQNPGYKIAATTGVVSRNPVTGEPMPDLDLKDKIRGSIVKVVRAAMELEGTAAPKRSITATFSFEERQRIEAEIMASDMRLSGREITEAEIVDEAS